jgi:aminoglycoside 2'-N-acetyltransferase I
VARLEPVDDAKALDERLWLRRLPTSQLSSSEIAAIRDLLWTAFPPGEDGFTEGDWEHALGGIHVVLDLDGVVVAHASVVERELHVGDRPTRTGYVEAVAVDPARQGSGLGTRVMREIDAEIVERFELGALGTGAHHFYERLGWRTWLGPTSVRTSGGARRTPEEDGFILVLPTPIWRDPDLSAPLSCDWRPGDVW